MAVPSAVNASNSVTQYNVTNHKGNNTKHVRCR